MKIYEQTFPHNISSIHTLYLEKYTRVQKEDILTATTYIVALFRRDTPLLLSSN